MKLLALSTILIPALTATQAHARFQHQIEQNTQLASEVQATPIQTNARPASEPSIGRAEPAVAARRAPDSILSRIFGKKEKSHPEPSATSEPLPKMPSDLHTKSTQIPGVDLPRPTYISRDPLPPMEIKAMNHGDLLAYSRRTRALKIPERSYTSEVRARKIVEQHKDALRIVPHKPVRTAMKLNLEPIHSTEKAPKAIVAENHVKRMNALFSAFDGVYAPAAYELWKLSELASNGRALQARDALFGAITANRAKWTTTARFLLERSARKNIDNNQRYLSILWQELENFENQAYIDSIVARISPEQVDKWPVRGDKAYYSLAKIRLKQATSDPEKYLPRIEDIATRDKLRLIGALAKSDDSTPAALQNLTNSPSEKVRDEANLALARLKMKEGSYHNALELYKKVKKDRTNRLDLISEQAYSEYKAGLYQNSLGKSIALQSEYFRFGFAPDVYLTETLSRKALCDFGGAENALLRFMDVYGRELGELENFASAKESKNALYEKLIRFYNKSHPSRFERALLRTETVMENQKTLNLAENDFIAFRAVDKERAKRSVPEGWLEFAEAVERNWRPHADRHKFESANAAVENAKYFAKRLKAVFYQAQLMGLDISTSAAKDFNLQTALNFPARRPAQVDSKEDQFHWPYEQEIWEDELEDMSAKNESKCAQQKPAQKPLNPNPEPTDNT